jgi:Protein of unknown function (DUF3078)
MKIYPFLLLLLILFPLLSFSQAADTTGVPDSLKNWKHEATFGLGLNQASFSSNWTGGGTNSIGLTSIFLYKGSFKKNKWSWVNVADLQYGFVDIQGTGYRKTIDKLFLDTRLGYSIGKKWDAIISANYLTQFAPGYRYDKDTLDREFAVRISDFMAPAYLTIGLGIEFHPTKYANIRISPYAPRFTFVTDTGLYRTVPNNYGVEIGQTVRVENGFQVFADFEKDLMKNLILKVKYLGYANYEKSLGDMDHRIDLLIKAKVNNLLNVGFSGILVYDTDQDADIQWNQAFTLNFSYTLRNFTPKKEG